MSTNFYTYSIICIPDKGMAGITYMDLEAAGQELIGQHAKHLTHFDI